MKIQVGQKAPDFTLPGHLGEQVSLSNLRGKNVVLVFFPLAWTPIWTNQIPSYEAEKESFAGLNAQVLGISVDHVHCLKAWAESLGGISYPLLSDFWPHGAVSDRYGVLRTEDGYSERAIVVIDKDGTICYIDVHAIDHQPDNEELRGVLRQLEPMIAKPKVVYPGAEEEADLPTGGIVLYCAKWCKDCKKAKAWLEARGLEYVEVDVDYNLKARNQARKWGSGALITPTFDIDGTIVLDFHEAKLEEALRKAGKL